MTTPQPQQESEQTLKITKREIKLLIMALTTLAGANDGSLLAEITDLTIKVSNAK